MPTPLPTPQRGSPGLTGLFTEPKPPRYFPEGKKKKQKRGRKASSLAEFKNIWENPVAYGFDMLKSKSEVVRNRSTVKTLY